MTNKLPILWSLCFIFFSFSFLAAQSISVSGIITDAETGETIPGAAILEKGTTHGTVSDFDGNYEFTTMGENDTIIFSFLGFDDFEVAINGRTNIDVALRMAANELTEIIVVGYGRQKKIVVTGAIANISAEEINSTPTLRVEQALQGRTPGVQVTNLSGQPGEEPTVRVRGTGTTGNSKPLYIVDGMAVGGIDYLNPGDIESINVLKDAASAAIYGARAANGVVLITTKTGSKGKTSLSFSTYYGIQNVARKIDMLNADEYRMLMNEGASNAGLSEPFDLDEVAPHNTNWQDHLFTKNAPMANYQLSVNGGNDVSSFASSLSYFTQEGIIGGDKSKFERYTARINSTHKVSDRFIFGNNLAYTHLTTKGVASNASFNGPYSSAINLDPLTPLFEENEEKLEGTPYANEPVVTNEDGKTYGISENVGAEVVNPIALLEIQNGKTRKDQLVGNVYGEFEVIEGLKLKSSLGIDLAFLTGGSYRPLYYLNGAQLNTDKTTVNKWFQQHFTWQWENTAVYEKQIGSHNFSFLAGTTAQEYNFEDLGAFNADIPINDPNHVYLNLATDTLWTNYGGAAHSALFSIFGRINYDYKNKYSVSAVIRRDGSSKFGANSRFGIFPSIGFAWAASEEEFLQNMGPINFLKFRASYGINGNQEIGDYQFVSTINSGRGYIFGSGRAVGASPLFIENADIRWEQSEQYDIGADIGLWEDKLSINVDFYLKNTKDLLERIPIPAHVGNDGPIANVGSVQNKGIELGVNWRSYINDFKYSIGVNGALNKNTMTHIGNTEKVINGASWAIAGTVTRSEEGLPIAYFWGYETDGIFQTQSDVFQHINSSGDLLQPKAVPGDVIFVDTNGDGIINEDDRTRIGTPTPPFTFGMTGSADYKGFDFSIFIQGTYGNDVFNGVQREDLQLTNRPVSSLDRWTGEGSSNSVPRYTWIDVNNNYRVSDLYIEDGSHIRIKNAQIGYTLPKHILNRMGATQWRFYISVENLFTFTNYSGADPEIGAMSSFDIGIDRAIYPQARTMRFGTSLTF